MISHGDYISIVPFIRARDSAVVNMFSVKKVYLKISQTSQENICVRISGRNSDTGVFL